MLIDYSKQQQHIYYVLSQVVCQQKCIRSSTFFFTLPFPPPNFVLFLSLSLSLSLSLLFSFSFFLLTEVNYRSKCSHLNFICFWGRIFVILTDRSDLFRLVIECTCIFEVDTTSELESLFSFKILLLSFDLLKTANLIDYWLSLLIYWFFYRLWSPVELISNLGVS